VQQQKSNFYPCIQVVLAFFVLYGCSLQLLKEKKTLEERLNEMVSQLGDEEEKAKQLNRVKTKYEAIIADLEERLKKEQEVDTYAFCGI